MLRDSTLPASAPDVDGARGPTRARSWRRAGRHPGWLPSLAALAALLVALPVLAVVLRATGAGGWDSLSHLASTVLPRQVLDTLLLATIVLGVVLVTGVGCAWLVAAFDFPGRRVASAALVLPLAMPAFVMAFAYTDLLDTSGALQAWLRSVTGWRVREYWFPDVRSLPFAGLFLGLALYPYVYTLARAAFAERPASLAEAARTLGCGPVERWWRVVWPVARPAVAAGCALVLMETLADFGTVSYFAVDTLSAGIYRAWQGLGDQVAAARLACVLLVMVGALVWIERRQRRRMRFVARAARPAPRRRLGSGETILTLAALGLPVFLGFVLPAGLLAHGWLRADDPTDPRLLDWALNSATLAAAGTALVLPLALLVGYAVRIAGNRLVNVAAAVAASGYAVPGTVLGVGLLALFGGLERMTGGGWFVGGTVLGVVYAYGVRFFSVGFQGVDASLRRIAPSMDASARVLGRTPLQVLRDVHWPLLRPGLASAGLLVFVDCLKELPATYALRPFDFDTLAVVAYHFAADERLDAAAAPALLIVAVGLVPVLLLMRSLRAAVDDGETVKR